MTYRVEIVTRKTPVPIPGAPTCQYVMVYDEFGKFVNEAPVYNGDVNAAVDQAITFAKHEGAEINVKFANVISGSTDPSLLRSATSHYFATLTAVMGELSRIVRLVPAPPAEGSPPCQVYFEFSPGLDRHSRALVLSLLKEEGFDVSGNPAWEACTFSWAASDVKVIS